MEKKTPGPKATYSYTYSYTRISARMTGSCLKWHNHVPTSRCPSPRASRITPIHPSIRQNLVDP